MSLLFVDNCIRFKFDDDAADDSTPPSSQPKKCYKIVNTPRVPSNLVKSSSSSSNNLLNRSDSVTAYDRQQLIRVIGEQEKTLISARDEYEQNYDSFFSLAKRFHLQKLNNLKLSFKNQILKQQIYFESELLDISKEFKRDYETGPNESSYNRTKTTLHSSSSRKPSKKSTSKESQFEREKHLVRLCKGEMKKLVIYMKEALINSCDTLIEAFETCQVLKSLEQVESSSQKQRAHLKSSTQALLKSNDESASDNLEKKLNEEEEMLNKYKTQMEELMHTLDDIELQHLQRKDALVSRTKFMDKLKTKTKYIENKYDMLNKQIKSLSYESHIYKQLLEEKERSAETRNRQIQEQLRKCEQDCSVVDCCCDSSFYYSKSLSSSLSPSSSSRSSSTSSLADCTLSSDLNLLLSTSSAAAPDEKNETNDANSKPEADSSSQSGSSSSSTSSLSNQDFNDNLIDFLNNRTSQSCGDDESAISDDEENHIELDRKHGEDNYKQSDDGADIHDNLTDYISSITIDDFNRKYALISDLINLHKAKSSSRPVWELAPSSSPASEDPANPFDNKKLLSSSSSLLSAFRFNDDTLDDESSSELGESSSSSSLCLNKRSGSSLDLSECSLEGDRVVIENSNLKQDRDISNWTLMRQVENISSCNRYQLPSGSIVKSGKVLQIQSPFECDQMEFLIAIRNYQKQPSARPGKSLKIRTKLFSPDGTLKAMHVQDIPEFYQEVLKYANLIEFL